MTCEAEQKAKSGQMAAFFVLQASRVVGYGVNLVALGRRTTGQNKATDLGYGARLLGGVVGVSESDFPP
jgi:hypothetical protein